MDVVATDRLPLAVKGVNNFRNGGPQPLLVEAKDLHESVVECLKQTGAVYPSARVLSCGGTSAQSEI